MTTLISDWRSTLQATLEVYNAKRPPLLWFYPLLFVFFVALNASCYWWGLITAFPYHYKFSFDYYFKVQFPVAFLGALFDSLSFFVTIRIIKSALQSQSTLRFVGHLSIDIVIAIIATFWVLWVFSFSSWLIRLTEPTNAVLTVRQELYQSRALSALENPTNNLRNIYFGVIMGVSAMLPTCVHGLMAVRSTFRMLWRSKPQFQV